MDQLIAGPHTLKEERELFVYAGWLSEILAWLAHDLGDPLTGEAYAIDCFEHADQAGHDELCGWPPTRWLPLRCTPDSPPAPSPPRRAASPASRQATRWRCGCTPSAHAATRGSATGTPSKTTSIRLTVCGTPCPAAPLARPDGTDTGPLATYAMTTYTALSFIWLGDYERARHHAERAVEAHEATPIGQRSLSREAIAYLDLGIALACLGSPKEAAALGLRALASPRLVASVRARATELTTTLATRHPGTSHTAQFQAALAAAGIGGAP
ncbi:tetratricopeptide repeat protein [Nonomuraea basaltis]|uniref:tetratricopeptide repeat protein n=1 Tax=Nonomuraea basaltis TaxID=2495887 RepID=UPI00110C646C|nr:tetratricopeptide repeat protein [Nonomuraea basaltis]TMR96811.1 tetratricopeptide repeat protein [Nonomuraea basaltis]